MVEITYSTNPKKPISCPMGKMLSMKCPDHSTSFATLFNAGTLLFASAALAQIPITAPPQSLPKVQIPIGAKAKKRHTRFPAQNESSNGNSRGYPNPDFEDATEEDLENGRANGQPPGQPPSAGTVPPSANDFKQTSPANGKVDNSKMHFKVVDGEYWEKGKRRPRRSDNPKQNSP